VCVCARARVCVCVLVCMCVLVCACTLTGMRVGTFSRFLSLPRALSLPRSLSRALSLSLCISLTHTHTLTHTCTPSCAETIFDVFFLIFSMGTQPGDDMRKVGAIFQVQSKSALFSAFSSILVRERRAPSIAEMLKKKNSLHRIGTPGTDLHMNMFI
jgi:hypothetical protein